MSSLVISLAALPRQIGSYKEEEIDWVVPGGWSTGVAQLPEGTHVPLSLSLTTVDDGVLVQIRSRGELEGECVRCLDPVVIPWEVDTSDVFFEAEKAALFEVEDDVDMEGQPQDEPRAIRNDTIDLEPLLRDVILADATLQPLCSEDCQGLCSGCGERVEDLPPGHNHDQIDPRFAALAALLEEGSE